MLPSAKTYLNDGGLSPEAAAYVTIGCFLGGVVGIQFVSRLLHHYIPSHVVDCDYSHDEDESDQTYDEHDHHHDHHTHKYTAYISEDTPLLPRDDGYIKHAPQRRSRSATAETFQRPDAPLVTSHSLRRPTFQTRLTNRMSTFVSGAKSSCDEGGPCYGYSEPCGHECFKVVSRSPSRAATRTFGRTPVSAPALQPSFTRTATSPHSPPRSGRPDVVDEEIPQISSRLTVPQRPAATRAEASARAVFRGREGHRARASSHLNTEMISNTEEDDFGSSHDPSISPSSTMDTANDPSHHHHVPKNAFLAIGLQTSIAIALHKLPEGFITYATNHANPKLGFAVFMALFIHNITEGFAMALPLYLAIDSRWKAMFWSSLLGGVSQPLGGGVAALWFKIAGQGDAAPGETVYGCMFAITAGIMASVALQLYSESLGLTHNRNLCVAFGFIGMGILGISFALTAS